MLTRTPINRFTVPAAFEPRQSTSQTIELPPLPTQTDNLSNIPVSVNTILNSTTHMATDGLDSSINNVSGISNLTDAELSNQPVQTLQNVIQQLRKEVTALRSAQQNFQTSVASTWTQSTHRPMTDATYTNTNMYNTYMSTLQPRELFPHTTLPSTIYGQQYSSSQHVPVYPSQSSATQGGAARLPYAQQAPLLPATASGAMPQQYALPPTIPPYTYTYNNTTMPTMQYPYPSLNTQFAPTNTWQNNTSMRPSDIDRVAKSWNVTFPPRDTTVNINAKKYLKIIEQRMSSHEIPFENFRSVVITTLTGHVLEWYYQNEHLFINWPIFKSHFKVWQSHQSDESILQEIFASQQGHDEPGVSFINRMQCAFSQLEEPLPEEKQIRIIVRKFNHHFLMKFADANIFSYPELYCRVSAWQSVVNSSQPLQTEITSRPRTNHFTKTTKPKIKLNAVTELNEMTLDKQTQDDDSVNSYDTEQTSLDFITNNNTPHRKASNSSDSTQSPSSFSPEYFQNMFKLLFEKLQLGTTASQPSVCQRCGKIGHTADPSEVTNKTIDSSDSVININNSVPEDSPGSSSPNVVSVLHDAPISDSEFEDYESEDESDQPVNPELKIHASYDELTDYLMPIHGATSHIKPVSASIQAPVEVSRMIAKITIDSHVIEALLDSGSERSYISEAAYLTIQGSELQKLGPDPTSTHGVTLADSGSTFTKGGAPFRIEIDGYTFLTWLSVLPGLSTPVILGLDFWKLADIRVESKTATWKLGDNPKGHQFCSRPTRNTIFSLNVLTYSERTELQNFLTSEFDKNKAAKLGLTHLVQHHIEVSDETPVRCKPYRRSPPVMQALHEKVHELLTKGLHHTMLKIRFTDSGDESISSSQENLLDPLKGTPSQPSISSHQTSLSSSLPSSETIEPPRIIKPPEDAVTAAQMSFGKVSSTPPIPAVSTIQDMLKNEFAKLHARIDRAISTQTVPNKRSSLPERPEWVTHLADHLEDVYHLLSVNSKNIAKLEARLDRQTTDVAIQPKGGNQQTPILLQNSRRVLLRPIKIL
ncbi:hypothetical protein KQX54_012256 [Cotesia glomerata]|uniref:Peptidase A2 domain-containing protein n=1 Tax=Cotesia glomerata TaxID=32391 RepID=A0AAV7IEH4_COTGL|nr:hypothetical protein KQX54_012256 [Cotesia glomerata]